VETTGARRACIRPSAARHSERDAVRVRGATDRRVRNQHKRIAFDKHLVAGLKVSISRLQIEDEICSRVRTRGKHRRVVTAFRIDPAARKTQLDVLGKSAATRHV